MKVASTRKCIFIFAEKESYLSAEILWSDAAQKDENSSELRANIRMQLGIDSEHFAAWLRDKHKSNS